MKKLKTIPLTSCERCGRCCGIVPCTETEFQRIRRYAEEHQIAAISDGVSCPFLRYEPKARCLVYEVRPLACRLFGHVAKMRCPNGHNVLIPEREAQRMVRANGEVTRALHELDPAFVKDFEAEQARKVVLHG